MYALYKIIDCSNRGFVASMDLSSVEKIFYGPSPSQYFVLSMPDTTPADREAAIPVAVIIHGGFWKQKYTIENAAIENLAPFFLRRGISTCVLEYRRVPDRASAQVCDSDAGGWPASNEDVFLAMSKLSSVCIAGGCSRPCVDKVFFVGHSAGGYLALWSCLSGNIGRLPFTPLCCVALAPVCDLLGAAERRYATT